MYRSEFLYKNIDKLVSDSEVFPICIPSYNRPNAPILKFIDKLPVILFIRREQEDMYKNCKNRCKVVLLDNVKDIGTTRKAIVDYAIDNHISNIFMLDDDITHTTFLLPGKSSVSDKEFMKRYNTIMHTPEGVYLYFFKMWVWLINLCDDKLTISSAGALSDWWHIKYRDSNAIYNNGSTIQCIHLNIENLKKYGINYKSNEVCGTEDYALQYEIMTSGLYSMIFKELVYRVPGVNSVKGGNSVDDIQAKYQSHIENFRQNILLPKDSNRVGTKVSKGGVPSIKFLWNKWRISEPYMSYSIDTILNYLELAIQGNITNEYNEGDR